MWVKMNSSNRSLTGRENASKTPMSIAVKCNALGEIGTNSTYMYLLGLQVDTLLLRGPLYYFD